MKRSVKLVVRMFFGFLLPVVVLVASVYAAIKLFESGPEAERRQRTRVARLVEVEPIHATDERVMLEPMGPVKAARSINLQPRVGGAIVEVADEFIPGGHFEAGQVMLQIDPSDYELKIKQRETEVAAAEAALRLEMGQQEIAKREFELLGEKIEEGDQEWVLRQPQLRNAQAQLEAAEANLELAKLELERTTVKAPFNCIVLERNANLGMQVSASTMLAQLADTDQFWIELAVPVDDLRWIEIPRFPGETGSEVHIRNEAAWGANRFRKGRVVRLTGEVDAQSRMATLLVEVNDPLALTEANANEPMLLLNSYIRAQIFGRELQNVISIDRGNLHEGDTLWIMNADNQLEVRKAKVLYRGRDHVLLESGLMDGEQIVTTLLSSPVAGMDLRVQSNDARLDLPESQTENSLEPSSEGGR